MYNAGAGTSGGTSTNGINNHDMNALCFFYRFSNLLGGF
jgi:hypothetical protein